jgi:L-ascorbate metabolism protein UlaG (beta-lactamase superfamily)
MATVTWLGHSCFEIRANGTTLIIDPFLTGNPVAQVKPESIKANFVLVSHGHGDHWGDTESIARRNKATVIGCNELACYARSKGLTAHGMHIGGGHDFPFGRVKLTVAHHGTGGEESGLVYIGNPSGFLLSIAGQTIYHSGDTALTYDMKLLSDFHKVDLALLPIGDNFTMGIDDAVHAVEFIKPKTVVPMHYNTFDMIKADPEQFASKVRTQTSTVPVVLNVGDSLEV